MDKVELMYIIADKYIKHVEQKSGRKFSVDELKLCLNSFILGWIKRGSVDDEKFKELYLRISERSPDEYYNDMMESWTFFL